MRTHKILEAVKPVSAGFAVISIRRLAPTFSVISSHSLAVRWSHQIIDGRITLLSLSSITRPCICPDKPTPLISFGLTLDFAITS